MMRKQSYITALIVSGILFTFNPVAYGEEATTEMTGIINPWVECKTLYEAEQTAGYGFNMPSLPGSYNNFTYSVVPNQVLQVLAINGDAWIRLSKSGITGEDDGLFMSEDQPAYNIVDDITVGRYEVRFRGFEEGYVDAVWEDDTYTYSIESNTELDKATYEKMCLGMQDRLVSYSEEEVSEGAAAEQNMFGDEAVTDMNEAPKRLALNTVEPLIVDPGIRMWTRMASGGKNSDFFAFHVDKTFRSVEVTLTVYASGKVADQQTDRIDFPEDDYDADEEDKYGVISISADETSYTVGMHHGTQERYCYSDMDPTSYCDKTDFGIVTSTADPYEVDVPEITEGKPQVLEVIAFDEEDARSFDLERVMEDPGKMLEDTDAAYVFSVIFRK